MSTEVFITISRPGDHTAARVLSFSTEMSQKETLQALQVLCTILKHYRKEPNSHDLALSPSKSSKPFA